MIVRPAFDRLQTHQERGAVGVGVDDGRVHHGEAAAVVGDVDLEAADALLLELLVEGQVLVV
jgi:hypothetical protein